jgi:hypothetical protein
VAVTAAHRASVLVHVVREAARLRTSEAAAAPSPIVATATLRGATRLAARFASLGRSRELFRRVKLLLGLGEDEDASTLAARDLLVAHREVP